MFSFQTILFVVAALALATSVEGDDQLSDSRHTLPPLHLLSIQNGNNQFGGRLFAAFRSRDTETPEATRISDQESLPWSCDCDYFWRDLGEGYFPRYVRDAYCRQSTCWFGHFDCIPQKYEMNVLKQIQPHDFSRPGFQSQIFEEDYIFTGINITVNCLCGRSRSQT